jgi:hypothetical protein
MAPQAVGEGQSTMSVFGGFINSRSARNLIGRELSAGRNSEILVDFLCENIDDLCMARNSGPLI